MGSSFGGHWLVSARCETPIVLFDFLNRHAVAVRAFLAAGPLGEYVENIVGLNRRSFVVETVAVGSDIIEPNRSSSNYLTKPVNQAELIKTVLKLLGGYNLS